MNKNPIAPAVKRDTVTVTDSPAKPRLKVFGGSPDDTFNSMLANDVVRAIWVHPDWPVEDRNNRQSSALVALAAFKPQDEIEAMLAAQAIAMHHASMECSRLAMVPTQPFELAQGFRKAAVTASRGYIELTTALDRKRGKGGRQTVRVEHVHVHPGGQAIVGNVTASATTSRGGGAQGSEGEPHAPPAALVHDPAVGPGVPAMRCEDPERVPLQVPGNGERPVPDARRQKHRAANRRGS